ncbi:MAG TPA: response regulator [Saprospiraceae bacterium]|nr:response regulator [Saprospiraceae bacterium]HND88961.1 response regulator [Saprospiraceae bacterium]HNG88721.1 response regulator [Saprospiraceae bacterium]
MIDSPVKILVVEDEMLIGAKISMFLSELGYEVTGLLPRAEEALKSVNENPPDIALLDIQLGGNMDGIAFAQMLQNEYSIPTIFLTANTDEATFQRAKSAKPHAFLAKPFKKLDLQRALELTIQLMAHRASADASARSQHDDAFVLSDRIFVRYKEKMHRILFEHLLYLEAERNYCRLVTAAKEYLLTMPMKRLEDQLPRSLFQRIHRSYVVNMMHIDTVDEESVSIRQKVLPLSKSYRDDFMPRLKMM